MAEVIAAAEALRAAGELPAYARVALADALLDQRRPEEAEAEYRAALAADPGALAPSLGLFFALAEQRRWAEARAIPERLAADIPAFRPLRGPEPPAEEWDRIAVETAAILWRLWSDDLAGAEAEAAPLVAAAPMNASLRALRADIWRLRGWPGQALEEYEAALTDAPDALDLRLGRAEALLDRRAWRAARAAAAELRAEAPENAAVRRLLRRLERHDMRELEATARGGLERGGRDPEFDLGFRLYSPPLAEDWRLFGGGLLRTGDTRSGRVTTWRALAGAEWRGPEAVVSAGVTLDREGVDRGGAFLSALLHLSDRWRLEAAAEATAADTPLAALAAGIHADAGGLGLTWRHSELREAAASFRLMRFSDDNTRLIGFARWRERVLNAPDWKLDLEPYAYATGNSRQGAPYFNPERDLELGLTGALTWIAWKRYDSEFRIRLAATGGGYWQEGFGWSPLLALRWENQHALSDTLAFSYGAGWVRRDYDGRAEESASVTAALRWRF
jgi:biofilm PGA synthesis protein PgaA